MLADCGGGMFDDSASASGPDARPEDVGAMLLMELAPDVSTTAAAAGPDFSPQQHCWPSVSAADEAWHDGAAFDVRQWLAGNADADVLHRHGNRVGASSATTTAHTPSSLFRTRMPSIRPQVACSVNETRPSPPSPPRLLPAKADIRRASPCSGDGFA